LLYVFGDSYSDSGAGYVDANGPSALVYLAERLDIPFTYNGDPNSAGKGRNFAVSAASSGEGAGRALPSGGTLGFGMKNQIESFVRYSKSGAISKIDAGNTMFFFAGGLNDGGRPDEFVRINIESEIDALYDLGARRFMVAILPTKIPQFAAAGKRVNLELEKITGEERVRKASGHPHRQFAMGILFRRGDHESCEIRFNGPNNAVLRPPVSPTEDSDLHQPRRPLLLPRGAPVHCRSPRSRGNALSRSY
jgi:hypothetical protein